MTYYEINANYMGHNLYLTDSVNKYYKCKICNVEIYKVSYHTNKVNCLYKHGIVISCEWQ